MKARKPLGTYLGLTALLLALFVPATAQAAFGVNSFTATAKDSDGSVDLRAGDHPFEYALNFTMNQNGEGTPEGTLSNFIVNLPPGMVGNPQAIPRCSMADFEGVFTGCPANTQVGVAVAKLKGVPPANQGVFNLTPPAGVAASFGFSLVGLNSFQEASLRSGTDYGASVRDITIPHEEIQSVSETIWGVPADSAHDSDRQCRNSEGGIEFGCPSGLAPIPFLSLPTSCTGPLITTVQVESVEEPGVLREKSIESLGEGGTPEGINSCERPPFEPTISVQPETTTSDSPTGLHVGLHIPQNDNPEGTATAHLKDTTITLPKGLVVNPSAADGLGACLSTQIGLTTPLGQTPIEFTPTPAECPANSKMGTVKVESPLVDHPLPGTVYLAKQGDNPFNSFIALYVTVNDPITGVVAKLPGKVQPGPDGQLEATFRENPQLPFEDFKVDFTGGPRAALTTPPTCDVYKTESDLTPWTSPEGADVFLSDSFPINTGPAGSCANTEAQMPNNPSFEAGTEAPLAGAYSPFVLKLSRENGSQRFGALNTTLPPGVAANFTGVQECSEAQIAQAQARANLGEGALEKQSPSCPQASQIGVVNVGAGSGSPFFVQGNVYLAGPYKGAPFSLAIITPGVAGPFDVGTVVVRAALYVNEETGQGTVKSDSVPTILHGIPLDVRTIAVRIDRSGYVLNPTSCDEKAVTGEEISTTGQVAQLRNRFQVGGCKGLDFTPKLSLSLKGATRRDGHPALRGVLTQPSGQANSRRIVLILPPTEFIDPMRTANPCTRPQFAEGKCPPASVLGKARAFTPLLEKPLEGPVYFRANGGARELPDAVADLHGRIHIVTVGFVDAVHKKGSESSRVRTTFANVPDAPLTKVVVELKGGKKGVLVNSANLCKVPNIATVKMTAQNNKAKDTEQRIATSCGKKK